MQRMVKRSPRPARIGVAVSFVVAGCVLSACGGGGGGVGSPVGVGAYWADAHWNDNPLAIYGTLGPPSSPDNCTNYVSGSLHQGNPPFAYDQNGTNIGSASAWWWQGQADTQHSNSWATVTGFYNWFTQTPGHGDNNGYSTAVGATYGGNSSSGNSGLPAPPIVIPNSTNGGAVFFVFHYNPSQSFTSQLGSGHTVIISRTNGIVSSWGSSSNRGGTSAPVQGTTVDAQTSNHYHEFWTLQWFNANWQTTAIRPVTIR